MKLRTTDSIRITERDLREQVRDLCKLFGWEFLFTWTSIHSPKGMLDLLLINKEQKRVIFAELKTERGKLTPEQQETFDNLVACGQEVYVWRPQDIEGIADILRYSREKVEELLKQETAGALIE